MRIVGFSKMTLRAISFLLKLFITRLYQVMSKRSESNAFLTSKTKGPKEKFLNILRFIFSMVGTLLRNVNY